MRRRIILAGALILAFTGGYAARPAKTQYMVEEIHYHDCAIQTLSAALPGNVFKAARIVPPRKPKTPRGKGA